MHQFVVGDTWVLPSTKRGDLTCHDRRVKARKLRTFVRYLFVPKVAWRPLNTRLVWWILSGASFLAVAEIFMRPALHPIYANLLATINLFIGISSRNKYLAVSLVYHIADRLNAGRRAASRRAPLKANNNIQRQLETAISLIDLCRGVGRAADSPDK